MTEPQLFLLANRALKPIIDQIKDDQWDLQAPAHITWKPNQTLRDLVNYHAYDDACVPDTLAGKGKDAWAMHEGDLLGDDPKGNYAKYNQIANEAVEKLQEDDLGKTVHLSYGDFTVREYLQHIALFRGLRSYDIAEFIGADTTMPDDLVQGLWEDIAQPHAEALRQMGVFGPAVEVPEDAPLQDRMLGATGRQPRSA